MPMYLHKYNWIMKKEKKEHSSRKKKEKNQFKSLWKVYSFYSVLNVNI